MTKSSPIPGAQRNRLPHQDINYPNFPTLKASDAVNFTEATPTNLPIGTQLFRVYGGPAREIGSYWSASPPAAAETEAYWRGTNAVELQWNDGSKVSALTAKTEIQAWVGVVASQPAENRLGKTVPGFFLPGRATQFKVMSKIDPSEVEPIGPTPWPKQSSAGTSEISAPAELPSLSGPKPQMEHAEKLLHLGHLMQPGERSSNLNDQMSAQFQRWEQMSYDFHLALSQLDSLQAFAQIQQQIHAHIGLRRHIYIPADWPNAAELNQALEDVISSAYQMLYSD